MVRANRRSAIQRADDHVRSLVTRSRRRAVQQFRRAAAAVPFYRRLLSAHRLRPSRVASLESFQALVPTITKRDVFAGHPLAHLLVTGSFDDVDTLIASSGHTAQSFSLGMISRTEVKSMVRAKTPARCVLVSDITGLGGMPPGRYSGGLGDLEVLESGKLVLAVDCER